MFCNVRVNITSVAEVQSGDGPTEILTLLRRALKRTVYLTERCLCEFINFGSEVGFGSVNYSSYVFNSHRNFSALLYLSLSRVLANTFINIFRKVCEV